MPAPLIAAGVIVLATALYFDLAPTHTDLAPARADFIEFPDQLGAWTGHRQSIEPVFLEQLKLDDYLMSDYSQADESPVNLYLAYYREQHSAQAIHSPRSCLPGGGWRIAEFSEATVPGVTFAGRPLRVNRAVIERAGTASWCTTGFSSAEESPRESYESGRECSRMRSRCIVLTARWCD